MNVAQAEPNAVWMDRDPEQVRRERGRELRRLESQAREAGDNQRADNYLLIQLELEWGRRCH